MNKLAGKIDRTRADIKKLANGATGTGQSHAAESAESTPEPAPATQDTAIPLFPRKEDFKNVEHWTPEKFIAIRHQKAGTTPERGDEPTSCQYMEDKAGNPIPLSL